MPSYMRVMMVTDFSATGDAAVPHAYALADPGAEVHLVHVIEHEAVPNPLYAHYTPDELWDPQKREQVEAEVERHLLTLIPDAARAKSITSVVGCVLHRHVPDGIVEEARRRHAEAVVMGSHGRTGLAHLLMGSVAEHVLRHVGVPVLIVPRHR